MKRVVLSFVSVMILITVCIGMTSSERQDKYVTVFHPEAIKTQDVAQELFGKDMLNVEEISNEIKIENQEILTDKPVDGSVQNVVIDKPIQENKQEVVASVIVENVVENENNEVFVDENVEEIAIVEENKLYNGVVYLTFDDGPVEAITIPILDVLKEYGVPATFFTLGSYGERHPEILKRQAEEGHTVANHSYSHQKKIFNALETFKGEVEKTNAVIKEATGKEVKFIRIPYGTKLKNSYKEYLTSIGMETISWNCESYDSRTPKRTAEQLLEGVKNTSKGKKEVVVIMHDTYGKEETVKALPSIIEYFKSLNYEFKAF